MVQYIDPNGIAHTSPLQFVAPFGTVYNDLDYESKIVPANDTHRCYRSLSPRRKNPNVKRAKKYFLKKKLSYTAAAAPINEQPVTSTDKAEELSRLQKQLSNQITKSVWEEKERIRLQERIKHLQENRLFTKRHLTRVERAYVATSIGDLPSGEVSITDSEVDADGERKKAPTKIQNDELKRATESYEQQMQQLFATLQEERKLHEEKLNEMNARMTKLQQEGDRYRATSASLTRQLLQQSSGRTANQAHQAPTKNTVIVDIPDTITTTQNNTVANSSIHQDVIDNDSKPHATSGNISATMEAMLEKFSELDDDSKKALMHHEITTNNETLQNRLMKLRESSGNNYNIAKLTKEIIKLAETYKVPELKFDEQAQ